MSILVNGSPLKPFIMEKGLRQGDSLSPYLFILVSKALVSLFRKAEILDLIEAMEIRNENVRVKHLQFADDTLIFVLKKTEVIKNYFCILNVFSLMSNLRLNYDKSSIITWIHSAHEWVQNVARATSCRHRKCLLRPATW